MELKSIRTDADHDAALKEIERLWDPAEGSADEGRLEILTTFVEAYEEGRFPLGSQT
jgi:HTH-type transcriptional regulator/antitoxin HigA